MFRHNSKVAFRNLLKNKLQTAISATGLAIGFTCFALSMLWIRYETRYDNFHPDASRIYLIQTYSRDNTARSEQRDYLKNTYPEIEEAATVVKVTYKDDQNRTVTALKVGPGFFRLFPLAFTTGSEKEFFGNPSSAIITDQAIGKLYNGTFPSGEKIRVDEIKSLSMYPAWPRNEEAKKEYILNTQVQAWTSPSDLHFDYLVPESPDWPYVTLFIKLHKGVDPRAFEKKLKAGSGEEKSTIEALIPLSDVHLSETIQYARPGNLTYKQLVIFATAGVVTILCFIFNYISIFISRLKQKSQELALRRVLGSSYLRIYKLLGLESGLLLLLSFLLSLLLIEMLMPAFITFSGIRAGTFSIWAELPLYMTITVGLSLLLTLLPLYRIRSNTLAAQFRGKSNKIGLRSPQNALMWFQLAVGLLFLFCTAVFIRQVQHLNRTDAGFDRSRLCFLEVENPAEHYDFSPEIATIRTFPEIEDAGGYYLGRIAGPKELFEYNARNDDGTDGPVIRCKTQGVDADFFRISKIPGRQGRVFNGQESGEDRFNIVINRTAAKQLNLENPVGQAIKWEFGSDPFTIIGVIDDIYEYTARQVEPQIYLYSPIKENIIFRYKPGTKTEVEKKITELLQKKAPDNLYTFTYMDEWVESQNRAEINFMKLLHFLSFVCITGALFGIYAMLSVACEQRRKEIAIRKINGAAVTSVIGLFLRKYLWLLTAAAVVAFTAGTLLVRPWLEQFILRATIPLWLYPLIYLSAVLLLSAVVVLRIWKSVHRNPVGELRKE